MKTWQRLSSTNGVLSHSHDGQTCLSRLKRDMLMLTTSTRLKLQNICSRLAQGQFVSLQERVYLQKFADRDRSVSTWLSRAQRFQREGVQDGLDGLMADLDIVMRFNGNGQPVAVIEREDERINL